MRVRSLLSRQNSKLGSSVNLNLFTQQTAILNPQNVEIEWTRTERFTFKLFCGFRPAITDNATSPAPQLNQKNWNYIHTYTQTIERWS
jgi:hypothetical protein